MASIDPFARLRPRSSHISSLADGGAPAITPCLGMLMLLTKLIVLPAERARAHDLDRATNGRRGALPRVHAAVDRDRRFRGDRHLKRALAIPADDDNLLSHCSPLARIILPGRR